MYQSKLLFSLLGVLVLAPPLHVSAAAQRGVVVLLVPPVLTPANDAVERNCKHDIHHAYTDAVPACVRARRLPAVTRSTSLNMNEHEQQTNTVLNGLSCSLL